MFAGHPQADVSLFSFGTIKTQTALGGGVLLLRDANLCQRLKECQAAYPRQPGGHYLKRLLKYGGLKLLSTSVCFGLFVCICRGLGINRNEMLNRAVRGFAGTEDIARFRKQPSVPLLAMLARRLSHPQPLRLERQQQLGRRLLERLPPGVFCPGSKAGYHHFWVFPVWADHPQELIATLDKAGFDATQGESMRVVEKPAASPAREPIAAREMLEKMVYLPMYPELSDRAIKKLADVLVGYFQEHPPDENPLLPQADTLVSNRRQVGGLG